MSDFSPVPVVITHWRSLQGARAFYGLLPVVAGGWTWHTDARMSTATAAACITVVGLTSAFFLQLSIQVADRASTWAAGAPETGKHTSEMAEELNTLAANAVYGLLASFSVVLLGVWVAVTSKGSPERWGVSLLVAGLVHVGLTVLLVGMRTFHAAVASTNDARTGNVAARPKEEPHKSSDHR